MKADRRPLVLVALGGNALLRSDDEGTYEEQRVNARQTGLSLLPLLKPSHDLILTHGNGPQVGNILLQNEIAADTVPPLPLHACVAETQGLIGSILQEQLLGVLRDQDIRRYVITMVTQVLVDPEDRAFQNPTKPIGPHYDREQAERLQEEKGWEMTHEQSRGYRRVVPSPTPQKVIQRYQIRDVARSGQIVVAVGGGGIPVVEEGTSYNPVDAVVDKDLASAELAGEINCDRMIILTDIDRVYRNIGTPDQAPVDRMSAADVRAFLEEGQAGEGSMKPKLEAALHFVEETGNDVLITSPEALSAAIRGNSGTWISRDGTTGTLHQPDRRRSMFPNLNRYSED